MSSHIRGVTFLLGLLILLATSLADAQNTRATDQLLGPVKTVMTGTALTAETIQWQEMTSYSLLGAMITRTVFLPSSEQYVKTVTFYSPKGSRTGIRQYLVDTAAIEELTKKLALVDAKPGSQALLWAIHEATDPGVLRQRTVYRHDDQRRLLDTYIYNTAGNIVTHELFSYTEQGRPSRVACFNTTGGIEWKRLYTYDEQGHLYSLRGVDTKGKVYFMNYYAYDAAGRKLRETHYTGYDENQAHPSRIAITFDQWENPKFEDCYTGSGMMRMRTRRVYTGPGKLAQETVETFNLATAQKHPIVETRTTTKYDAKGWMTERERFVADAIPQTTITTYTRVVDTHGNWTEQAAVTNTPNGTPETAVRQPVVKRVLTYHAAPVTND